MSNINFTKQLIKGRIAETIFEHMLRESGFTVMHFGYEYLVPEITHNKTIDKQSETMKSLRSAPDFAIIDNSTKEVRLVEIKYQSTISTRNILKYAKEMKASWNPSYIFVASESGFYFDSIADVIKNSGEISKLHDLHVSTKAQEKYLKLLIEMEPKKYFLSKVF